MRLRLTLPALEKELNSLLEVNTQLRYELDRYESPAYLMQLLEKPEFAHLHYPSLDDVVIIEERRGGG